MKQLSDLPIRQCGGGGRAVGRAVGEGGREGGKEGKRDVEEARSGIGRSQVDAALSH